MPVSGEVISGFSSRIFVMFLGFSCTVMAPCMNDRNETHFLGCSLLVKLIMLKGTFRRVPFITLWSSTTYFPLTLNRVVGRRDLMVYNLGKIQIEIKSIDSRTPAYIYLLLTSHFQAWIPRIPELLSLSTAAWR